MTAARDVAVNATVSIAGVVVPANVQGTGPDAARNMRPIIVAAGLANNLIGFGPSTSAKSGFKVTFVLPYTVTPTNLNAMLATGGVTVAMQFGTAGGATVANCQWTSVKISGQQGGDITVAISYDSSSLPTVGSTVAASGSSLDPFKFSDVTSFQGVSGTVYTDVTQFSFDLTRNLAKYVGNSTTGVPKYLKGTHVESAMMGEYMKVGDGEGTAFLGGGTPNFCPTKADMIVILTQICPAVTAATFTFTASNCFYQNYPTTNVATEDFISESATGTGYTGGFSIAA